MKKRLFIFLLFIINFLIFSKSYEILVIDKDLDIPLEGVKVVTNISKEIFLTNHNGKVILNIPDDIKSIIITTYLIGYETKKTKLDLNTNKFTIKMNIEGILQGKELVVEEKIIQKKDEKSGVSIVVDKEEIKSSAMIGPVEDIMSSIKTLPGVSYAGKFDSKPSVRGGDPNETSAVLDGFLVRIPYHWGGAYSIFNPNIIETVKFSNGIFSAKYGVAMSALIEITTITPDSGFKFNGILSTTTSELFLQTTLWKNSGLFLGARITYLDFTVLVLGGLLDNTNFSLKTTPYIRDGYFKWFWKPTNRVEWYINGFLNTDGVGISSKQKDKDPKNEIVNSFNYNHYNIDFFTFTGLKILPVDNLFIHILCGYELLYYGVNGNSTENGSKKYSQEFIKKYDLIDNTNDSLIFKKDRFEVNNLRSDFDIKNIAHSVQGRIDFDITLHNQILFSYGAGILYDIVTHSEDADRYTFVYDKTIKGMTYKKVKSEVDTEENNNFNSFIYLTFNFNILPNILSIETGFRIDHFFMFNKEISLNTYPQVNPRFNLVWTPIRKLNFLEYLTFSIGAGVFSKVPLESSLVEKKYGLKDFEFHQPSCFSSILGVEIGLPLNIKIKFETYYKYYFLRFYFNADNSSGVTKFYFHSDGTGHAAGFDILIQRKISRWIDGWISYSFIFSKYLNPSTDNQNYTWRNDPTNQWYYPKYHRWHNLNLVLNIKPLTFMTITTKFGFASGTPKREYEQKEMLAPVKLSDNSSNITILELYRRGSNYKEYNYDSLRYGFSLPLDIELRFHFFVKRSKVKLEIYVACEDILIYLYIDNIKNTQIDKYTGEEMEGNAANFNLGFPVPSIGIKINF